MGSRDGVQEAAGEVEQRIGGGLRGEEGRCEAVKEGEERYRS